jgi:hypothetical protein
MPTEIGHFTISIPDVDKGVPFSLWEPAPGF